MNHHVLLTSRGHGLSLHADSVFLSLFCHLCIGGAVIWSLGYFSILIMRHHWICVFHGAPPASFLHDALLAAFRLLGVSLVLQLLLLHYALGLRVSSSVPVNQLFPSGLLLGFSGVLFWLGEFVYSIPFTILQ